MIIKPYTYDGTAINDGSTYTAWIGAEQAAGAPPVRVTYVRRPGAWPVYAGKEFMAAAFWLNIDVSAAGVVSSGWMDKFETLNTLFNVEDEEPVLFVIKDESDSDTQYQLNVVVDGQPIFGNNGAIYSVKLALVDQTWDAVTQSTSTFTTTSATDSTSVTVGGNAEVSPTIEVTPGSGSGWIYSRALQILPTSSNAWPGRALCLTSTTDGTTFDTAALIAALKMQSSSDPGGAAGADLRVLREGVEVNFWASGMNSTDTKLWTIADMPAASNMVLGTAISTTDTITEIVLKNDATNRTAISALPAAGRLIIDSGTIGSTDTEEFTYTGKIINASKLAFTVDARAVRNTDTFTHAANQSVRFMPYDFTVIYGNLTCEAADVVNTKKPVLDLSASSNSSFVWDTFYDEAAVRNSIWQPIVRKVANVSLSRSDIFTSTSDEGDTDPATEMGMKALSYLSGTTWKADTVEIVWVFPVPDVIASITASGEQSLNNGTAPTFSLLSRKASGQTPTTLWSVTKQVSTDYGTFTAWSKATTDYTSIPSGTTIAEFSLKGTGAGSTDVYAKFGVSDVTIGITNYPNVIIRSEVSDFRCDFTLINGEGESIRINYPVKFATTLIVDCDPDFPTARYNGQIVNGAISTDEVRPYWFRLLPGTNTIGYESNVGAGFDVSIAIKWNNRVIFL